MNQKSVNKMNEIEQMRHWIDIAQRLYDSKDYQIKTVEGKDGDAERKVIFERKKNIK